MPFKDLCEGRRGCGMKVGSGVGSGGGISLQEASRCAVDGGGRTLLQASSPGHQEQGQGWVVVGGH